MSYLSHRRCNCWSPPTRNAMRRPEPRAGRKAHTRARFRLYPRNNLPRSEGLGSAACEGITVPSGSQSKATEWEPLRQTRRQGFQPHKRGVPRVPTVPSLFSPPRIAGSQAFEKKGFPVSAESCASLPAGPPAQGSRPFAPSPAKKPSGRNTARKESLLATGPRSATPQPFTLPPHLAGSSPAQSVGRLR